MNYNKIVLYFLFVATTIISSASSAMEIVPANLKRKLPDTVLDEPKPKRTVPSTVMSTPMKGRQLEQYKQIKFFYDEEIIKHHIVESINKISESFSYYTTKISKGRTINYFQQKATKGCAAAVVTMFLIDHELFENINENLLRAGSLYDFNWVQQRLQEAGLTTQVTAVEEDVDDESLHVQNIALFDHLKDLTTTESLIITVTDKEIGGHWIIVDEVRDAFVIIRDPFHGWCISVKPDAFLKRIKKGEKIISIAQ